MELGHRFLVALASATSLASWVRPADACSQIVHSPVLVEPVADVEAIVVTSSEVDVSCAPEVRDRIRCTIEARYELENKASSVVAANIALFGRGYAAEVTLEGEGGTTAV